MKKTYFKKALCIIVVIAILITALSLTVSARYQYIGILSAGLTIDSNGLAVCTGMVQPSDSSTHTTLIVELQKYSNGWVKVETWNKTGTGTNAVILEFTKYVVHGTYQVRVTANIYSSSGTLLETQSMTSYEVTY